MRFVHSCTLLYMTVITMSEARRTLAHQLDLVQRGEEIEISRYGEVVARLVAPRKPRNAAAAAALRRADEIGAWLEAARDQPLMTDVITAERAEELIADIRAGRDAR